MMHTKVTLLKRYEENLLHYEFLWRSIVCWRDLFWVLLGTAAGYGNIAKTGGDRLNPYDYS